MNPTRSFPVVALGASAGGFEALERFLSALPDDFDFALVFVQHFSPKHQSLVPDLLRRKKPGLEGYWMRLTASRSARGASICVSPPGRRASKKALFASGRDRTAMAIFRSTSSCFSC